MNNIKKIQEKLIEKNLDAVLVTDEKNQRYATGFPFTDGAVIVARSAAWLITDSRYIEAAHNKVQDAEMLIFETLADLAEDGIDPAAVEAAVNSVEFSYRENNSGRFPRGLSAMIQALSTWLYDGDPLAPLAWEGPLADIKARLAAGEKVFENAIRDHFLNNEHRATVGRRAAR